MPIIAGLRLVAAAAEVLISAGKIVHFQKELQAEGQSLVNHHAPSELTTGSELITGTTTHLIDLFQVWVRRRVCHAVLEQVLLLLPADQRRRSSRCLRRSGRCCLSFYLDRVTRS